MCAATTGIAADTTVVAVGIVVEPRPDYEEIQAVGWFTLEESERLEMHPAALEMLRAL
jgi:hypothetical protein